jgi:cysteine synthase
MHGFSERDRVSIYLQMAIYWPLYGNLKLPAVFEMFQGAIARGELTSDIHAVVDSSSGNTALYVAKLAYYLGKKAVFYVRSDIATSKEALLRGMGNVELIKCSERAGEPTVTELARERGQEKGHHYLGQYDNLDNVVGHLKYHVQAAWEQLGETMTGYVGGLGTGGHIDAALRFSQTVAPVTVVAAYCAENNPLPGIRPLSRLTASIARDCLQNPALNLVEVFQPEAYRASKELAALDLDVGPTSGAAWMATCKFLHAQKQNPEAWEKLLNAHGRRVFVVMCGDRKSAYEEDRYRLILDASDIPCEPVSDYSI